MGFALVVALFTLPGLALGIGDALLLKALTVQGFRPELLTISGMLAVANIALMAWFYYLPRSGNGNEGSIIAAMVAAASWIVYIAAIVISVPVVFLI